jgi:hypothetical protein
MVLHLHRFDVGRLTFDSAGEGFDLAAGHALAGE